MRQWFDQGYESFSRTFPDIAAKVGYRPFYVCPQCLKAFPESAIEDWLTQEHVPPESVGGKKIVLTCKICNHSAGHSMDADMRREANIIDFFGKRLVEVQATMRTPSGGEMPIRLSASNDGYRMFGVPKAAHPDAEKAVTADLNRAALPDGWQDFSINLRFEPFSTARAEASWLRTAYLAFFAACGYRFVVRPELTIVRQRISEPNSKAFTFRIVLPRPVPEPLLTVIKTPETFRSFAMIYGQHIVFLPMYGDSDLYSRLASHPAGNVELTTEGTYGWPDRPLFLHDRQAVDSIGTQRQE